MALKEQLTPDEPLDPLNEEILNVIRKSDSRGLGTSAIVDEVDLKADAVRDRLHGLEAEEYVESETIGSKHDYNFIWYLADDVRERPVNPEIARLVYWCEKLKRGSRAGIEAVTPFFLGGVVVILLTLTALQQGFPTAGMEPVELLVVGWVTVIVAVGFGAIFYATILFAIAAEWFGERKVEQESR